MMPQRLIFWVLWPCVLLSGCSSTILDKASRFSDSLSNPFSFAEDHRKADEQSNLPVNETKPVWMLSGKTLVELEAGKWLDRNDQSILTIECGHLRQWERPGQNLVGLVPLQSDPFLVPDPNQLVSAQTWFWVVSVSDDEPRVAQSRYQKTKIDDGGYRIEELWEIRDLNYLATNEYVFTETGIPIEVRQAIHPALPVVQLAQNGYSECRGQPKGE